MNNSLILAACCYHKFQYGRLKQLSSNLKTQCCAALLGQFPVLSDEGVATDGVHCNGTENFLSPSMFTVLFLCLGMFRCTTCYCL